MINKKNTKLIQYYLDMKFISKHLLNNLDVSDPSVFCKNLIKDIKGYYDLEDLIIIDSLQEAKDERNTVLRAKIIDHIKSNWKNIEKSLTKNVFITFDIHYQDVRHVLHISSIMPKQINDGLIICVERSPSLLSENEVLSLESIVNLLKTRLIYA